MQVYQIEVQDQINVQALIKQSKINDMRWGNLEKKLVNVPAPLFGTLEYTSIRAKIGTFLENHCKRELQNH